MCAGEAAPPGGARDLLQPLVQLLMHGTEAEGSMLWAAYFSQPAAPAQPGSGSVASAPPPDAALHLDAAAEEAARLYGQLFDGAVMFQGAMKTSACCLRWCHVGCRHDWAR